MGRFGEKNVKKSHPTSLNLNSLYPISISKTNETKKKGSKKENEISRSSKLYLIML